MEHRLKFDESDQSATSGSGCGSKHVVQTKLVLRNKLETFQACSTQYELNRDLAIWASLDLEPFMFVEKEGMKYFVEKNFPMLTLPSRSTVSRGALYDVYDVVASKVKEQLQEINGYALCVMMDGWTDKYKRYPYLGIRVAYVNNAWDYCISTISLKVLEKHTAENMASHIREELSEYGVSLPMVQLFTTHDGAANMMRTSMLLRSAHAQHCVAHSLHLLIMNDGINKIPELVDILMRCKAAVIKLDSKCYIVDNERAKTQDRQVLDSMLEKISASQRVLQADEDIDLEMSCDDMTDITECESDGNMTAARQRTHRTPKQSCITRWNSVLEMIDSILCLWKEFNEALKVNGDKELCLTEEDKLLLIELQKFLLPFRDLTELVSAEKPHLALIPLIIKEVTDATRRTPRDSAPIIDLKDAVKSRICHRIKTTDTVVIATLLDPSMRRLVDRSQDEKKMLLRAHAKSAVEFKNLKMSQNVEDDPIASTSGNTHSAQTDVSSRPQNSESQQKSKKLKLLEKFSAPDCEELDRKIEDEVDAYMHMHMNDTDENPLLFWKTHQQSFPNLSILARNYLSISASSVPVEAMFSSAGLLLNVKRSSMAPYRANILTVIHDNYKRFFPVSRY